MASFSFDIVSEIDKAEMNNVFMQAEKEIQGRYDFKGTSAAIDWLDDKKGLKITGDNDWQVDAVLDIVRKKFAGRGQSSKVLDLSKEKVFRTENDLGDSVQARPRSADGEANCR